MDTKEFMSRLDAGVSAYMDDPGPEPYCGVLETLFSGIREDAMLKALFHIDAEAMDAAPAAIEYEDGSEVLVVLTDTSGDAAAHAVPFRVRALVKEMDRREKCGGILFDSTHGDLFVPKSLIKAALGAGYRLAMDEIEAEAKAASASRSEKELVEKRPLPEDRFAEIAERIRAFDRNTDDFLKISFPKDDDLLFLQVLRADEPGKRRLSFGYDMDEFGWEEPLVLGGVLTAAKTLEILRKVCVEGVPPEPDEIKELEEFRPVK